MAEDKGGGGLESKRKQQRGAATPSASRALVISNVADVLFFEQVFFRQMRHTAVKRAGYCCFIALRSRANVHEFEYTVGYGRFRVVSSRGTRRVVVCAADEHVYTYICI